MAAGGITTLPALPEDGASGGFPPVNFKEPKRLYCKNGGFFLRIHPDGRVDGIREKSDPRSECICTGSKNILVFSYNIMFEPLMSHGLF
uniref:Uncharacterized protein n=1 Tax=Sinocyclocheilus anshuiensis TaxID=1608454 RepID=A0A671L5B8_9TELE